MAKMLFTEISEKNLKKQVNMNTFTVNSKDSGNITQESIRKTMESFFNHEECKDVLNKIRQDTDPID
jgi:hypothetical protein